MNKILESIKHYTEKLQQTSFGWKSPNHKEYQEKLCKELDTLLMNYCLDDVMTYLAAKVTKPEEEDTQYLTINFMQEEK